MKEIAQSKEIQIQIQRNGKETRQTSNAYPNNRPERDELRVRDLLKIQRKGIEIQ